MLKNTVTGSILARILPATVAKHFLENASQEDVNKAEQEAAVLHQQLQAITPSVEATTPPAPTASVPAPTQGTMPLEVPAPASDVQAQLTAMTTRATTAEASVSNLTTQLATANQQLAIYKAWHDKHSNPGTALPTVDASNRGQSAANAEGNVTLSEASASALTAFQSRRTQR